MRILAHRRRFCVAAAAAAVGAGPVARLQAQAAGPAWTLTGTVDASYVSANGNSDVTTMSIGARLAATRRHWTLRHLTTFVYGVTDGIESANQLRAAGRVEYRITHRFSGFAGVTFERNSYAGFNTRVDELYGAQARVFASATDTLSLDIGGVYTQQANTDGSREVTPSARGALLYVHAFSSAASFTQSLEYVPDLTIGGAYRMNSESTVVGAMSKRLGMKVGYVVQFNSQPPEGFGITDRVFTCGLQVSF